MARWRSCRRRVPAFAENRGTAREIATRAPNGPRTDSDVLGSRRAHDDPAAHRLDNARLIVHLPLILPANCRFRVGNDTRDWRTGEAWVFDDTIEHEAWNDSDEVRVILIFDVWNPLLSEAERLLVTAMMNALNAYEKE